MLLSLFCEIFTHVRVISIYEGGNYFKENVNFSEQTKEINKILIKA